MPTERRSETERALTTLIIRLVRELSSVLIRFYLREIRRLGRASIPRFIRRRRECVSEEGGEEQPDDDDDDDTGNETCGIYSTRSNLNRQRAEGLDEVDH